jgi:membrane protease YdiL (CAAX protease family)
VQTIRTLPTSRTQSRHRILYLLAACIYLIGLIEAQLATVLIGPVAGILFFAGLLLLLLLHTAREADSQLTGLLLSIACVVVIRIASFSVPPESFSPTLWLLLTIACLFSGVMLLQRTLKLSAQDIGLTLKRPLIQIGVALSGILIGVIQFTILDTGQAVTTVSIAELSIAGFVSLVSQAFLDELLFRGVLQRSSSLIVGWWSVIYVSLLYSTLHLGYGSPLNLAFILIVALYFGLVRGLTNSIIGTIVAHVLANTALFVLLSSGLLSG